MIIHGVPVDICPDRMGVFLFFTRFGEVNEVKVLRSKARIATGDMEISVTVDRKHFNGIPNILTCRERRMLVVVEGRKPCC